MIASHHKGDHDFIKKSILSMASYVGLIASTKRSGLSLQHFKEIGMNLEQLGHIHAPAGLEMKCNGPQEIALSAISEIIRLKNKEELNGNC